MVNIELLLKDLEIHGFDIQEAKNFLEKIRFERAGGEEHLKTTS